MNYIRRAITAERQRLLKLSPVSIVQQQHASSSSTRTSTTRTLKFSKAKPPPPVTWPKPSEIPWQAKVVNSVNLIGRVKIPVHFEASFDGKSWAGTIISQDDGSESSSSLTSFWIPVIFEGDLAHIAMCHLKEKDYVHVAGHLSVDVPPLVQANVQVMAHSINFVQIIQSKKISTSGELDREANKNSGAVFSQQSLQEPDSISIQQDTLSKKNTRNVAFEEENHAKLLNDPKSFQVNSKEMKHLHSDHKLDKQSITASWRDLLTNSKLWVDNRENKRKGLVKRNYPDFKHKDTGVRLWLKQAPVEVLQGLGQLEFFGGYDTSIIASWRDLLTNSKLWVDNRENKRKGLVKRNYPDFKHKGTDVGLWLKQAPVEVLQGLGQLEFFGGYDTSITASWRDLLTNSKLWVDNRENKRKGLVKHNYPDFKHKGNGVGLWLKQAPVEVLQGLGQLEFFGGYNTSIIASWRDLLTNSKLWFDNRENKRKGLVKHNYPDFKHKDTGVGLWLKQAPVEVLQGLGQLEFFGLPNKDTNKGEKGADSWKHLFENPNRWWDDRVDKINEKGPDFKNKDFGQALWLVDAPSWALSSLPPLKSKTVDVNTKKKWGPH